MKELKLVAKGGVMSLTGDAINYSLSYVFLLLAANFLGPGLLGSYYWAISIVSLAGEFADAGLGQGLIYFGQKDEVAKGENGSLPLFRFVLIWIFSAGLILGLSLFLFAPNTGNLKLFALILPLTLFWPVVYKYCVARFQIVPGIMYGDVLRPILRVSSLLLFLILGLKVFALFLVEFFVAAILLVIGLVMIKRLWGKGLFVNKLDHREIRHLFLYSLPFLPLNLARGERIIIIITGLFLPADQLGIFAVALKLAALSQVILTGINFVFRPMVTRLYTSGDLEMLKSLYQAVTRWIFILTVPLSFIFIAYPALVLSLFGRQFPAGAAVLIIVTGGFLFEYGTSATQVIINMTGRSWLSLLNQIILFAIMLSLSFWLIPLFGIVGAGLTVAGGLIAINLLRLWQSWRIVGFLPYSLYLLKPIVAVLLAGGVSYYLLNGWPAVVLFAALYLGLILIFRLNNDDLKLLKFTR